MHGIKTDFLVLQAVYDCSSVTCQLLLIKVKSFAINIIVALLSVCG